MVHGRDESKHHAAAQQPICRPRLDGEARWEEGHWDEWVVCHGGEVDDDAIEQMLRSPADVRTVCSDLVRRALDAGGHDNVSVVVVEAVEVVGQSLASESTAGNETGSPDSADTEVDEDTLPRRIIEDGPGR